MAERWDWIQAQLWGWLAGRLYRLWQVCCARAWTAEHRLRIRWAMKEGKDSPF